MWASGSHAGLTNRPRNSRYPRTRKPLECNCHSSTALLCAASRSGAIKHREVTQWSKLSFETLRPLFISSTSREALTALTWFTPRRPQAGPGHQSHRCRKLPSLDVYYSLKVVIVPQSINTGYAYRNKWLSLLFLFFLATVVKPDIKTRAKRPGLQSHAFVLACSQEGKSRKICTQEETRNVMLPVIVQGRCASRSRASTCLFR